MIKGKNMWKILFISLLFNSQAHALDLNKYIQVLKKQTLELLGMNKKQEQEKIEQSSVKMPELPQIVINRTSTDVYNKTGHIYEQGYSFNQLSLEDKRKYRVGFLEELYLAVMETRVKDEELIQGLNVLEQGGSREGVYRSLVMGADYMSLENFKEPIKEELVKFVMNYGRTYLGLEYNSAQLYSASIWTIKKLLVEKTLELIDSFPTDGEDLYAWYAYMSVECANKTTYSNKLRKSKSLERHQAWAKDVPFQQIKSEVIIKLHLLMNQLS